MAEQLGGISSVFSEHDAIRHYLDALVSEANDLEKLVTDMAGQWDSSTMNLLADKQFNLQQSVGYLHDGMIQHERDEDRLLPPLLGNLLMDGIRSEHHRIWDDLRFVESWLADVKLEELMGQHLSTKCREIKEAASSLRQRIEAHIVQEESILHLIQAGVTVADKEKSG